MKKLTPTWEAEGYFDLSDSNNHVGSLYTIEDMMTILSIPNEHRDLFIEMIRKGNCLGKEERIKEPDIQRDGKWKCLKYYCSEEHPKRFQSLSELELIAITNKTFGNAINVETQVKVGRFYVDIKVNLNQKDYYIEFLGPQHFYSDDVVKRDCDRKNNIENRLGLNVIEWLFWIQLCEKNVRIAFEEELEGTGAIWGSEIFFGESSEAVKKKIISLSKNFHAIREDGIGYFYEEWKNDDGNLIKPAHPIIERIKEGKIGVDILLPMNIGDEGKNFWLPKELWK